MKYDFTTIMNRGGRNTLAVDGYGMMLGECQVREGVTPIPMWVADMSFATVPTVPQAIMERVNHPEYGYFFEPEEYYNKIIEWHSTRNKVTGLTKECIGYENGVLGGVVSALNILCSRGDKVLLHSPTYIGFTMSLENNGYDIIHSPLVKDADGIYRMDFEDMEKKIVENNIHVTVFCSPHNPSGRVWERWELEKAMELFKKHDVMVVSDEIWSDLILEGYEHIPVQSVSEDAKMRTLAMYAPSKTFNLAGLVGSYHIIYNKHLRDRIRKESSLGHYNNMNLLSMHALLGAYKPEGYEWVDELCQVITKNVDYACAFFADNFEGIAISKPQGTYMIFPDFTEWCEKNGKTIDDVFKAGIYEGVIWQRGDMFHGENCIRMNLALPYSLLVEALDRIKVALNNL
ncbi:MAG: aminotransferase class I/II-fold pyridoxal phosphate-dependent enzyme [Lachnospiraceae bacterium]|nr:aminotransferase class I/II-fold pyridoxal phosphate-dependent enzyme [Lachnospiraceae bacterium]